MRKKTGFIEKAALKNELLKIGQFFKGCEKILSLKSFLVKVLFRIIFSDWMHLGGKHFIAHRPVLKKNSKRFKFSSFISLFKNFWFTPFSAF